jgi:hypothetical protein
VCGRFERAPRTPRTLVATRLNRRALTLACARGADPNRVDRPILKGVTLAIEAGQV